MPLLSIDQCQTAFNSLYDSIIKRQAFECQEGNAHLPKTDFNHYDVFGSTLLIYAILSGKLSTVQFCVEQLKTDINYPSFYDELPLSIAMRCGHQEIVTYLLSKNAISPPTYFPFGNIFNASPEANERIFQAKIMCKMWFFLKLLYRDTLFFDLKGHCNGFVFLKAFYAQHYKPNYYFNILSKMLNWNGTRESLYVDFKTAAYTPHYKNLYDLFEQWINDLLWFQQSLETRKISGFNQWDRDKQYQSVKPVGPFFSEKIMVLSFQKLSLYEIKKIFYRVENNGLFFNLNIELSNSGHVTSLGYRKNKGTFDYYDPNLPFKKGVEEIDFIFKSHPPVTEGCSQFYQALFFLFEPRGQRKLFFSKNCLCFSALHKAVIENNLSDVQRIIKNSCAVNKKDIFGQTPISLALEQNFLEVAHEILKSPYFDWKKLDRLAATAYLSGNNKLLNKIIFDLPSRSLNNLLSIILYQKDAVLLHALLCRKMADIENVKNIQQHLIFGTEKNRIEFVKTLVHYCSADNIIKKINDEFYETPLSVVIQKKSVVLPFFLDKLKESGKINQCDDLGYAPIHYAADTLNVSLLRKLTFFYNADVTLPSDVSKKTAREIAEDYLSDPSKKEAATIFLTSLNNIVLNFSA